MFIQNDSRSDRMFRIGYRTIKTAIGTAAAISLAQFLGLHNFPSAGIITILCIKVTKKKSLQASWNRFLACLIAMVFSTIFFEGIAYHPVIIGLMLLFFIPTVVAVKAQEGIVTSSVIILHIYSAKQVTLPLLLNETSLIMIGIGIALIMNVYMPSMEKKLYEYQEEIEKHFSSILKEIVRFLTKNVCDWDGKEITETSRLIAEAKSLAFRDVENHFLRHEDLFYQYFEMREKQFEIIERILPLVTSLPATGIHCQRIADFIEELSENVHPHNTAHVYLKKLDEMMKEFKEMELPKTREEFEVRAALIQLTKELRDYLLLKQSFKGLKKRKFNQVTVSPF